MKKFKSKKGQYYSGAFKESVAKAFLSEQYSAEEIKERYNLPYTRYVYRWAEVYRIKHDMDKSEKNEDSNNSTKGSVKSSDLPESVEDLQTALFQAEMKIASLEELISLAEERFHIPIRKKSGSKQ